MTTSNLLAERQIMGDNVYSNNKKYGLWHKKTKQLVTVGITASGDEAVASLTLYGSNPFWLVDTPEHAAYVKKFSTDWYNATHSTPQHEFEEDELEVVAVQLHIEKCPTSIPTIRQYIEEGYKKQDPKHYQYLLKTLEEHPEMYYTLYDLIDFLREKKGKIES